MQANVKLALLKPRSAVWCFVQETIGGFKLSFNFSRAFPVQAFVDSFPGDREGNGANCKLTQRPLAGC